MLKIIKIFNEIRNLSEQNTQDLKEILENLSRAANGIDISDEMIEDVDVLTEEEKFSLVRKYDIYMYLLDNTYYDFSLMIALNLSEIGIEKISALSQSLKIENLVWIEYENKTFN